MAGEECRPNTIDVSHIPACDPMWHQPVMVEEVMGVLRPGPTLLLVDATLGDGGHAMAWLQAGGIVFGVDRDGWAIRRAEARLERWERALTSFAMSFSDLAELPIGEREVWAVLLDLGTSKVQIEDESRGFSYLRNGPLDMRMDQTSGAPLSTILNRTSVEQLATWLSSYGDVPAPRRVAKAILSAGPPETSDELVSAVVGLFPPRRRNKDLARVFQALRIATNQEQQEIARGLSAAVDILRPGGRVAVLTYHSGEERAVRGFFRRQGGMCVCPPGLPVCACGARKIVRTIAPPRERPSAREVNENSRSRSARLWVAEKLDANVR